MPRKSKYQSEAEAMEARRAQQRAWYWRNRDSKREYKAEYYRANREKLKENRRAYKARVQAGEQETEEDALDKIALQDPCIRKGRI